METALIIFFITRFFFLAGFPFFYDSPEYLKLSSEKDLSSALVKSHESIHPVYLFLIQISQKIFHNVSLVSAIFGFLTVIIFLLLVKRLFNKQTALFSLIPLIIFPHIWLIQTNILHEAVDHFFLISSFLFFDFFLREKKLIHFLLSLSCFFLAVLNFSGNILWSTLFLGLIFYRSEKKLIMKNLVYSFFIIFGALIMTFLSLPKERLFALFINYGQGNLLSGWTAANFLRMARNSFLILFGGYSPIAPILILIVLFYLIKKNSWRDLILFISILLPFFITSKFWYGGLYGRFGSLIGYGLTLVIARLPQKLYWGVIFSVLVVFIPALVAYQQAPYPLIQKEIINQTGFSENDLLILSDYQRPQLTFKNALYINGNLSELNSIEKKIDAALTGKKRVFITSQAITFPYRQYDGQQIHIISWGDTKRAVLKKFLDNKRLVLVSENKSFPLLNLYQCF